MTRKDGGSWRNPRFPVIMEEKEQDMQKKKGIEDSVKEARAMSEIEGYKANPEMDDNIRKTLSGEQTFDEFSRNVRKYAKKGR